MTRTDFLIENYRTMPFDFYQWNVYIITGYHVEYRAKTIAELLKVLSVSTSIEKWNEMKFFPSDPQGKQPKEKGGTTFP